jgi:hypothetical protein
MNMPGFTAEVSVYKTSPRTVNEGNLIGSDYDR